MTEVSPNTWKQFGSSAETLTKLWDCAKERLKQRRLINFYKAQTLREESPGCWQNSRAIQKYYN